MQKANPKAGGSQFGQVSEVIHQPEGTHQSAVKTFDKPDSKQSRRGREKWHLLLRGKGAKYSSRWNMALH